MMIKIDRLSIYRKKERLCINTTWGELSSEWGELSSEYGASCFGASFLWGELSQGEMSLVRVVLFPGLRPMRSKKLLVHCSCSYIYMQEFCFSKCHISRPFHKHLNTFVWLLFNVPENKFKYVYAQRVTSDYVAFLTDIET